MLICFPRDFLKPFGSSNLISLHCSGLREAVGKESNSTIVVMEVVLVAEMLVEGVVVEGVVMTVGLVAEVVVEVVIVMAEVMAAPVAASTMEDMIIFEPLHS